jgi:hypothetical protein
MKPSLLALTALLAFPVFASAAVYKCQSGGQTVFSDRPCGASAEKVEIRGEKKRQQRKNEWEVIRSTDEMTGKAACVAKSPNTYMGKEGSEFLFASLRVMPFESGFIVGARSEQGFDSRPASLHTNIDGLGVRAGEFGFKEFSVKQGSYVVGLAPEASTQLVEELRQSEHFRIRLRYWPYQETFDSPEVTTDGLVEALQEVQECQ